MVDDAQPEQQRLASRCVELGSHATADSKAPQTEPAGDVLFVHSRSDSGYNVIRSRDNRVEIGRLQELTDGQPLTGELVQLHGRREHEQLFDVEVLFDARANAASSDAASSNKKRTGPAQVATQGYRRRWEQIFGERAGSSSCRADEVVDGRELN